MRFYKYIIWAIVIGTIVGVYYHVLTEPASQKESYLLQKIHSGKYIAFYNIDNEARVLVNDSLIFDSGIINNNPVLDLEVGLLESLRKGKNLVKVELRNRDCDSCEPTPWGIRYELIEDGEVVDFVHQNSTNEDLGGGLKFEKIHEIFHTPVE